MMSSVTGGETAGHFYGMATRVNLDCFYVAAKPLGDGQGRTRYLGFAREFYNLVMTCPKCKGEMEVGFVAGPRVVEWIDGPLHKSTLLGVKVREGKQLPIRTFRCIDSGFLESYAK